MEADMMAQALQRLIEEEGPSPFADWAQLLAPYTALLLSREPLLTVACGTNHMRLSPLLWLVTVERVGPGMGRPLQMEPLLRHVLALHEAAGVAAPLEQAHHMRLGARWSKEISPLHWVLYCRCYYPHDCTQDISLERLALLLRLGGDPNARVLWYGGVGHESPLGHSPLFLALTHGHGLETAATLLAFGARFDPVIDAGGLVDAMLKKDAGPVLRLLRAYPSALQGVQHTLDPAHPYYASAMQVLVERRSVDTPGGVADARFLHETLGLSLLPRDTQGRTAAEVAARRTHQTAEWRDLCAYLERAENAEALEGQRRMSLAVHHALQGRLGPELTAHIGNHDLLPRETFARFGREPPPPI